MDHLVEALITFFELYIWKFPQNLFNSWNAYKTLGPLVQPSPGENVNVIDEIEMNNNVYYQNTQKKRRMF